MAEKQNLPPHWVVLRSSAAQPGRDYYYNNKTRKSVWTVREARLPRNNHYKPHSLKASLQEQHPQPPLEPPDDSSSSDDPVRRPSVPLKHVPPNPTKQEPDATRTWLSSQPSFQPKNQPSFGLNSQPPFGLNAQPSFGPNAQPSFGPNAQPSFGPNAQPSFGPNAPTSFGPNAQPSFGPNAQPSFGPNAPPSFGPNAPPSFGPNAPPSFGPNSQPNFGANIWPGFPPYYQFNPNNMMPSNFPPVYPTWNMAQGSFATSFGNLNSQTPAPFAVPPVPNVNPANQNAPVDPTGSPGSSQSETQNNEQEVTNLSPPMGCVSTYSSFYSPGKLSLTGAKVNDARAPRKIIWETSREVKIERSKLSSLPNLDTDGMKESKAVKLSSDDLRLKLRTRALANKGLIDQYDASGQRISKRRMSCPSMSELNDMQQESTEDSADEIIKNITDDNDNGDVDWEMPLPDPLKGESYGYWLLKSAPPNAQRDLVYICLDTNIYLCRLDFVNRLFNRDKERICRLLVPVCVNNELGRLGDKAKRRHWSNREKQRCKRAAAASRFLLSHINRKPSFVITESAVEAKNMLISHWNPDDEIASCCIQYMQKNIHVILVTNDISLCTKAAHCHIPCYQLKDLSEMLDQVESDLKKRDHCFKLQVCVPNTPLVSEVQDDEEQELVDVEEMQFGGDQFEERIEPVLQNRQARDPQIESHALQGSTYNAPPPIIMPATFNPAIPPPPFAHPTEYISSGNLFVRPSEPLRNNPSSNVLDNMSSHIMQAVFNVEKSDGYNYQTISPNSSTNTTNSSQKSTKTRNVAEPKGFRHLTTEPNSYTGQQQFYAPEPLNYNWTFQNDLGQPQSYNSTSQSFAAVSQNVAAERPYDMAGRQDLYTTTKGQDTGEHVNYPRETKNTTKSQSTVKPQEIAPPSSQQTHNFASAESKNTTSTRKILVRNSSVEPKPVGEKKRWSSRKISMKETVPPKSKETSLSSLTSSQIAVSTMPSCTTYTQSQSISKCDPTKSLSSSTQNPTRSCQEKPQIRLSKETVDEKKRRFMRMINMKKKLPLKSTEASLPSLMTSQIAVSTMSSCTTYPESQSLSKCDPTNSLSSSVQNPTPSFQEKPQPQSRKESGVTVLKIQTLKEGTGSILRDDTEAQRVAQSQKWADDSHESTGKYSRHETVSRIPQSEGRTDNGSRKDSETQRIAQSQESTGKGSRNEAAFERPRTPKHTNRVQRQDCSSDVQAENFEVSRDGSIVLTEAMALTLSLHMENCTCTFVQIMEDVLTTVVLLRERRTYFMHPPWNLHEAAIMIDICYKKHKEISEIAKRFAATVSEATVTTDRLTETTQDMNNTLKGIKFTKILPKSPELFVLLVNEARKLLAALKNVCDTTEIDTADRSILDILENLQSGFVEKEFTNNDPSPRCYEDLNDDDGIPDHVYKPKDGIDVNNEVIMYLKKHYKAWETYTDEPTDRDRAEDSNAEKEKDREANQSVDEDRANSWIDEMDITTAEDNSNKEIGNKKPVVIIRKFDNILPEYEEKLKNNPNPEDLDYNYADYSGFEEDEEFIDVDDTAKDAAKSNVNVQNENEEVMYENVYEEEYENWNGDDMYEENEIENGEQIDHCEQIEENGEQMSEYEEPIEATGELQKLNEELPNQNVELPSQNGELPNQNGVLPNGEGLGKNNKDSSKAQDKTSVVKKSGAAKVTALVGSAVQMSLVNTCACLVRDGEKRNKTKFEQIPFGQTVSMPPMPGLLRVIEQWLTCMDGVLQDGSCDASSLRRALRTLAPHVDSLPESREVLRHCVIMRDKAPEMFTKAVTQMRMMSLAFKKLYCID